MLWTSSVIHKFLQTPPPVLHLTPISDFCKSHRDIKGSTAWNLAEKLTKSFFCKIVGVKVRAAKLSLQKKAIYSIFKVQRLN